MKNKILLIGLVLALAAAGGCVMAKNDGAGANNKGQQIQQQTQTSNQGQLNQIQTQNQEKTQEQDKNRQQGQTNAQEHRSTVSNFVQSLKGIADKEGGIGEQVREVAQQQNQSADTTIQAMEKIRTRSKIKTFLFGSDYKNLGALRSEVVQTRNRLEKLNRLMESVQNEGEKTELQSQIQTLEREQEKIENFVKDNENKLSLFGWLVKMLNK